MRLAAPFSALALAFVIAAQGCSTLIPKNGASTESGAAQGEKAETEKSAETPTAPAQTSKAAASKEAGPKEVARDKDLNASLTTLTARLEAMESKLAAQNEKLEAARVAMESMAAVSRKPRPVPVIAHAASRGAAPVHPDPLPGDREAGFTHDQPVQAYRAAMILFRGQKYSDAVIAFSDFLDKFPDHPLAGNAQFYVGESYFKQNEYKLALHEFQRVLTSYDRSSHVAQTLHDMAESEDKLKKPDEAARHRQQLSSLFPHSPFTVRTTASRREPAPPAEAVGTQAPAAESAPAAVKAVTEPAKLDGPPPTVPISNSESPAAQGDKE